MKNIKFLIQLLFLLIVCNTYGQENKTTSFKIKISQPYLKIPIKKNTGVKNVKINYNNNKFYAFDAEINPENPDWYAYMDVSKWKGKEIIVDIKPGIVIKGTEAFTQSEKKEEPDYDEIYRGQLHFSPQKGWLNDPNGLVYYNGEYHLFYQHNPYATKWGNMHWGHAISKDLIHWKEQKVALYPDEFGTIYSGGAVVDYNNTSGLKKDGKVPLFLFYTAAGNPRTQNIAISYDGRNFEKYHKSVVEEIVRWNRDPKVIWHEPTKKWIMVVYGAIANDQHVMYFLRSSNLIDWERTTEVFGDFGKSNRYLYECPEFFELPVEGNEKIRKWILTGANGQYAIGVFDGYKFTPEVERLSNMIGRGYYAAQTFSDEPKGRRIEIGWWQTDTDSKNMNFNQSMSLPGELKLVETEKGLRLAREPIKELEGLRRASYKFGSFVVSNQQNKSFNDIKSELFEMRTSFPVKGTSVLSFSLRGVKIDYNMKSQELIIDGIVRKVSALNGSIDLIIYVDKTGLEIFANKGLYYYPYAKNIEPQMKESYLHINKGETLIDYLDIYELSSIWKNK